MKPATTITKVCRILDEFRNHPYMGVTDLARRTDLLPSDVHRLLKSLQSYGYIEQDPATRTYRLGTGVLKLGLAVYRTSEFQPAARSVLKRLSESTGAATHMALFDDRELDIFLFDQIELPGDVFKARLGAHADPHSTALGKAVLAHVDYKTTCQILERNGMPRSTVRTITKASELRTQLETIRNLGYSLDLEESLAGACCIGAPLLSRGGSAVGAISVSMLASRFYQCAKPLLAGRIKTAAAELSASLPALLNS